MFNLHVILIKLRLIQNWYYYGLIINMIYLYFRRFTGDPGISLPDRIFRHAWLKDPLFLGTWSYPSIHTTHQVKALKYLQPIKLPLILSFYYFIIKKGPQNQLKEEKCQEFMKLHFVVVEQQKLLSAKILIYFLVHFLHKLKR